MGRRPSPEEKRRGGDDRRIMPWLASVLLHVGLVAAALLVTWSVIQQPDRAPPRPIVADFRAHAFLPVDELPETTLQSPDERPPEIVAPPAPVDPPAPVEFDLNTAIDLSPIVFSRSSSADRQSIQSEASFAGTKMTNARSIVYVIDASGSMTTWLPLVLEALSQSLNRLDQAQRYAVLFFQSGRAIRVPPENRLQRVSPRSIRETLAWTQRGVNLIPGGNSDPLAAMEAALLLEPDVIFLLSEGLDGPGGSVGDHELMMQRLDELNPIADPVSGMRWTRVQCIQIGDDEMKPGILMQRISERHGGPDGWTGMSRTELMGTPAGDP